MHNFTNIYRRASRIEALEDRNLLTAVPFAAPMEIDEPLVDEPTGVVGADLDNDGVDELVVEATVMSGFREVTGFHIFKKSAGEYQLQRTFTDESPTIADLDGDGLLDVAAIRDRGPVIYWNAGDGTFPRRQSLSINNSDRFTTFRQVQAGDFDNDGDADLALTITKLPLDFRGIVVSENDGNGNFGTITEEIYLRDYGLNYTVADVDADGDDDIVSYSYSRDARRDQLVWHESTGDDFDSHTVGLADRSSAHSLRADDTDGDGKAEIVLQKDPIRWRSSDETTSVFRYDANSNALVETQLLDNLHHADNLVFLDTDGDNDVDVLRQDEGELQLFVREADGFTAGDVIFETTGRITDATTVNLDTDGLPDFAVVSADFDVLVTNRNQGANKFESQTVTRSNVDNISKIDGADLNGDGRTDLLVSGDSLVWYPASPNRGEFESPIVIDSGPVNSSLTVDLDDDGDLDIVKSTSDDLVWLENDGGTFAEHRLGGGALGMSIFDFNRDSRPDVIYATAEAGDIVLLENQGPEFIERQRLHIPDLTLTGTIFPGRFNSGQLRSDVRMNELQVAQQGDQGSVVVANFSQDDREEFGVLLLPVDLEGTIQHPRLALLSFDDDDTVAVGVGDMNLDGSDDVMISVYEESAYADWIDLSDFDSPVSHEVQRCSPECFAISTNLHDVDGDGDLDSISPWAWFENIDGLATKFAIHRMNGSLLRSHVSFFDINGDGFRDIVGANDNKIAWLRNQTLQSDWNNDGTFDNLDIHFVDRQIRSGVMDPDYDFDENGTVNNEDFYTYLGSHVGYNRFDVNLDGRFDSSDLVVLFRSGKYEKDEPASWAEGDFDGNNRFDSSDIIDAFFFGYEQDPFDAD